MVKMKGTDTTKETLTLEACTGQTADILRVNDENGTKVFGVDQSGVTITAHEHKASDVTSEQFGLARMPRAASGFLKAQGALVDPAYAAIASGDLPSHNHAASDVNSGRLTAARMLDGASGVLKGKGTGIDPAYEALVAGDIPALDASKIATGRLTAARMLDGATGVLKGKGAGIDPAYEALVAGDLPSHSHAASDLTSGRLIAGRMLDGASGFLRGKGAGIDPAYEALLAGDIPDLAASKITSERFGLARMPAAASGFLKGLGAGVDPAYTALAAEDILSGTVDGDRLPAMSTTKRGGVPATGAPSNKFLRDDATWQTPAGSANTIKGLAHYIVYVSGGTYYAQSMDDGDIDYSNADFQALIAAILAGVPGAVIYLRPGTYSVPANGLQIYGSANNYCILEGAGEGKTILQATGSCPYGVIDARAFNVQVRDMTINGNSQASTYGIGMGNIPGDGYVGYCASMERLTIQNCTLDAIRFRDQLYYAVARDIRALVGNVYGFTFDSTSAVGDNGQSLLENCEVAATSGALRRINIGGTYHRINVNRSHFNGGGTYIVDLYGFGAIKLDTVDIEVAGVVTTAMLRASGRNTNLDTLLFANNGSSISGIVDSGAFSSDMYSAKNIDFYNFPAGTYGFSTGQNWIVDNCNIYGGGTLVRYPEYLPSLRTPFWTMHYGDIPFGARSDALLAHYQNFKSGDVTDAGGTDAPAVTNGKLRLAVPATSSHTCGGYIAKEDLRNSYAKMRRMHAVVRFTQTSNQYIWLIVGTIADMASATNNNNHIGFFVNDGAIYGTIGNGATNSKTASLGTLTADRVYQLDVLHHPGQRVSFYMKSGTTPYQSTMKTTDLLAQLSSNLPTADVETDKYLSASISNKAVAEAKEVDIYDWRFAQYPTVGVAWGVM